MFTNIIASATSNAQLDDFIKQFGEVSLADATDILDAIIKRRKRIFNYQTSFPATDAQCAATFTRAFIHQDWVDGESVVQAEQTTGEAGFNLRFHNIEQDIDSLAAEMARAFVCIAEMRTNLNKLLEEIRTEINHINGDVFECCVKDKPLEPGVLSPLSPDFEFLGASKFMNTDYLAYRSSAGSIQFIPQVQPPSIDVQTPFDDPLIRNTRDLAVLFQESRDIKNTFKGKPITKEEMIDKFGALPVGDTATIKDLLEILPDGKEYSSLSSMVNSVAERNAVAIGLSANRTTLAASLGVGTDVANIQSVPVDRISGISENISAALKASGVGTVGDLAKASPTSIVKTLKKSGVGLSMGEAVGLAATAKVFSNIH